MHSFDIRTKLDFLNGILERERRFLANLRSDCLDDVMIENNSPGTCEWVLNSREFQAWLSGSHNTFWIQGKPRAGKTVLAKFLYRQLCDVFAVDSANSGTHIPQWASIASNLLSRPRQVLAYFLDVNSPLRNSELSVLHSLIYQVLSTEQSLFRYLRGRSVFLNPEQGDFGQYAEVLSGILRDPSLRGTIIVLDALDECGPTSQHKIIDVLSRLADQASIRLLVTSRPQKRVRPGLLLNLNVSVENVDLDIKRYVQAEVSQLAVTRGFSQHLRDEMTQKIRAHSSKGFIWVQLVVQSVSRANTARMVRETLEHLPQDLFTACSEFLDGTSGSTNLNVRRALYFVMIIDAPLQIKDLSALLAIAQCWDHPYDSKKELERTQSKSNDVRVTLDLNEIAENQILDFERYFREHFSPLLSLKENSVSLVHFSLREFLETSGEGGKFPVSFRLQPSGNDYTSDLRKVHGMMAALCLQYMLAAFQENGDPLDFLAFACANWAEHAPRAGAGSRNFPLDALVRLLFSEEKDYATSWLSTLANGQALWVSLLPLKADIAFVLAAFDLCSHFGKMLGVSVWSLQSIDQEQRTPLHLAAANNSLTSVHWIRKVLCAAGFDLGDLAMRKDSKGESPIFLAAQNGHEELMKLLLSSVKPKYELDSRLFRAIAESGNMKMFETLYEYTHIDSPDQGMSLLTDAAVLNRVDLLERIISDHGGLKTSQNALEALRDSSGYPLIHIALRRQANEVVEYLLGSGYKPTAIDGNWNTALHIAVQEGSERMVKALIRHGVSMNSFNKSGETALHIACKIGLPEIVRLLCHCGCNVNLAGPSGCLPAHLAAETGQEETLMMLFDYASNIDATDRFGRNALHFAAGAGQASTLSALLKVGADLNARDYEGKAPVHSAIESGDLGILYTLCEARADLSASDYSLKTPLHLAVKRLSETLVRELIRLVTDPNAQDVDGRTPLHYSCLSKQSTGTITKILLENGADVNVHDQNGIAPMHLAAEQGFDTVVRELALFRGNN